MERRHPGGGLKCAASNRIARRRILERKIVGFHQDEEEHWVADLACGHTQHVRHDPPWMNRPWVIDPEGRKRRIGTTLNCKVCEEEERGM